MNRIWKFLLVISALIIIDQLTKGYVQNNFALGESVDVIKGFFNFTYVRNTGAAFGMGADYHDSIRKPLFLFLPVVACIWLVWLIWKVRHESLMEGWAYSLILSGAIGNLIDRFSLGYVVDFLDFYIGDNHFPAFNVADSAISVAAGMLILNFLIQLKDERNKAVVQAQNGDDASGTD